MNFYLKPLQFLVVALLLVSSTASIAQRKQYNAVYSGVPWFDDRGRVVSAHGANIIKDNGRYYLFGEAHTDTSNAFAGFNCYSSTDLCNWKFESLALPVQESGKLGPNRVGERPKVMKSPKTGEYIMLMHTDTLGYRDPCVGYATSSNITGPYTFRGAILFNGNPIKKWDMGSFQDSDGSGYLLVHSGNIYKLSDDYKSIAEHVVKDMEPEGESPAMFKKGDTYYWLASHRTSWERNDNFYYTATSIKGPWTARGIFAPEGSLTWNSQTSFVLPLEGIKDTVYMFMGDRWAFPRQASAATYVWQPITVSGTSIFIPEYREAWQINPSTGTISAAGTGAKSIDNSDKKAITYSGKWEHSAGADGASVSSSDAKDASFSVKFNGTQIGFHGLAQKSNGYAFVNLVDSRGKTVLSSVVDMYCSYPVSTLKFLSPVLAKDTYTLKVTVMRERGNWSDKRKIEYGSKGFYVTLDKVVINE